MSIVCKESMDEKKKCLRETVQDKIKKLLCK